MISRTPKEPCVTTAKTISKKYYAHTFTKYEQIFPNVYPQNWSECDLLGILPSGYTEEIEIKMSLNDFLNDFDKTFYSQEAKRKLNKHQQLSVGHSFPNRFSFLVHPDIVTQVEQKLPPYAGLLTLEPDRHSYIIEVKKPPLLHKNKITKEHQIYLYRKLAFRFIDHWRSIE